LADANFVQNKMQKDYFSKRIQRKTFIVPNPVNPRFFESHKEYRDKITQLVAIGRLNPQKNYPRLIDAVCLVRQSHPDIRLKIYGEGGLQDDIAELIRKKNATDYISLEGRTSDVIGALGDSDLYIMSSDYEGMPNALMEAMAFGMPCVSTDCPTGPAELIGENERGYLADMKSLQSLQDAISYMIDNPAKAKEAGVAAREYMMNGFSAKEISARFYRECTKY
jgi:glycosyltransferase involved in cell wall biosynthesis